MISEQDCTKILNDGDIKLSIEDVRIIRDLMIALATIQYEVYLNQKTQGIDHNHKKENSPIKAA